MEVGVRGNGDGLGVDIGEPLLIKEMRETKYTYNLSRRASKAMVISQTREQKFQILSWAESV